MPDPLVFAEQLDTRDRLLFRLGLLPEPRLEHVSGGAAPMLGYSLASFSNPDFIRSIVHPYDQPHFEALLDGSASPDAPITVRFRRRDGATVWAEIHFAYVRRASGEAEAIEGVIRDVTKQKRAEQRMTAQYAVTRILADSETLRHAARALLRSLCEILDWDRGVLWELAPGGQSLRFVDGWQPDSAPPSLLLAASRRMTLGPGEGVPGEAWSSGQTVWIPDVRQHPAFRRPEAAAGEGIGSGVAFPIRIRKEVLGVIELFTRDVRQPDGDVSLLMANVGSQIGQFSERRRAERERKELEHQFYQSQKMEAVGHLAGGVAHDFNNLLTAILGYCELLLDEMAPEDPRRMDVQEIKRAGDTAAVLTRQLLTFSRRELLRSEVLDLNAVAERVHKLLQRLIGENIDLVLRLEPALHPVRADPGQLEQVIVNLAVNARDAMPRGGTLTIETMPARVDEAMSRAHIGMQVGDYVELRVSDTGHGIPPELQARLFEPFFTTKERGKGTGLGLATVYGIVKQSHGHILVQSEVGRGSTFRVLFPPAQEPISPLVTVPRRETERHGSELVLVVEDDRTIRELTRKVLERSGYHVLAAENGPSAVAAAREAAGGIDLLLTDVVLPGSMSGTTLAAELTRMHAGLKVLYTSGYAGDTIAGHGVANGMILEKPFTPDQLLARVGDALKG